MNERDRKVCKMTIRAAAAVAGAAGAGMAQLPMSDLAIIATAQTKMISVLAGVLDRPATFGIIASMGTAVFATWVLRCLSQILVGWLPGFGNIINAATAAGITESTGWIMVTVFDRAS